MLPRSVMDNLTDGERGDLVLGCEQFLLLAPSPSSTDIQDRCVVQLGGTFSYASHGVTPSFCLSVPIVVGLGAEKQVSGIATGRIVAAVQYAQTGRDIGLVSQGPSDAMGVLPPTADDTESSIAVLVSASAVGPARDRILDIDVRPETVSECGAVEEILGNGTLRLHFGLTSVMPLGGTFAASPPSYYATFSSRLLAASDALRY